MSLGMIKHSRRKTKAASWRKEGARLVPRWPDEHRGLTVNVRVKRGPPEQGGFYARACIAGRRTKSTRARKCSTWVFGGGPTKAVKSALSSLARGLR